MVSVRRSGWWALTVMTAFLAVAGTDPAVAAENDREAVLLPPSAAVDTGPTEPRAIPSADQPAAPTTGECDCAEAGAAAALPAGPLPGPLPPPSSAATEASTPATCAEAATKPTSPWTKVPPPYTWPPLGWAFFRPTGPGYYSLRDLLTGNYRDKPPPYPWPPFGLNIVPFYDSTWQYLDKPDNTERDWIFDHTTRLHPNDNWMFSIGGEERIRYANEVDSRLSGKDNSYELERSRIFGDLWYKDVFHIYVEFLDAESFNQTLPPLAIDRDRDDLLNAFIDLKIYEVNDTPVYFRAGRQELIYGSERLITSKDWANTLQTFQGLRTWYRNDKWSLDAFYVQPVIPNPEHFASVDDRQGFAGLWGTYRPTKDQTFDLYALNLENSNPAANKILVESGGRGGFNVTTLGFRSFGEYQGFVWDFEPMYQFGNYTAANISAEAVAAGVGWHFANWLFNPTFWIYDEFASGSQNPGHGTDGTFNQLFAFGHYYMGWLDEVGRQNINDINMDVKLYPSNWITCMMQYHMFRLDSAKDALYNAAGTAIRRDPTGKAGTDVGDELDFLVSFHLDVHQDILLGYSHLYAGEFIKRTGPSGSPDLFYAQYSFRW